MLGKWPCSVVFAMKCGVNCEAPRFQVPTPIPNCAPPPKILSHEKNPPHVGPPGYCIYGMLQGLAWWTKGQHTVPLLSTGSKGEPLTNSMIAEAVQSPSSL